jgi:hypothetical protein
MIKKINKRIVNIAIKFFIKIDAIQLIVLNIFLKMNYKINQKIILNKFNFLNVPNAKDLYWMKKCKNMIINASFAGIMTINKKINLLIEKVIISNVLSVLVFRYIFQINKLVQIIFASAVITKILHI